MLLELSRRREREERARSKHLVFFDSGSASLYHRLTPSIPNRFGFRHRFRHSSPAYSRRRSTPHKHIYLTIISPRTPPRCSSLSIQSDHVTHTIHHSRTKTNALYTYHASRGSTHFLVFHQHWLLSKGLYRFHSQILHASHSFSSTDIRIY